MHPASGPTDPSYIEHVLTDHLQLLQATWDIFRESDDPEAVRIAAGVLMNTKTGRDYAAKMNQG